MSRFTLVVFAALSWPRAAAAWGPVGHDAVAMIAQKRLSAPAAAAVADILGPGVDLYKIANCADELRYADEPFNCGGAFTVEPNDATALWHFIDLPIGDSVGPTTLMTYCPNGGDCVVAQVRKNLQTLGSPSAARGDKQLALMFLVHFVGDEHQPLHCSDDDDEGGNKKKVVYLGARTDLHAMWDDLLDPPGSDSYKLPPEVLAGKAASLVAGLSFTEQDAAGWTQGDLPAKAALESFALAQGVVYPSYAPVLDDAYQAQYQGVARRRVAAAGVRLAYLLNGALGAPGASASAAQVQFLNRYRERVSRLFSAFFAAP